MSFCHLLRVVIGGALLATASTGCIFNVEPETKPAPPRKGGVDVKIDRNKDGLDVDVDIEKPRQP